MTVRLLHAHSGNLFGGIETMLLTLLGADGELDHAFALAFDDLFAERLRAAGVTPHALGSVRLSRPWTTWRARRRLRALLEHPGADALVCHSVWALGAFGPVAMARGVPLVAWLHAPPSTLGVLDRLARRVRPDLVIANSQYTAARVPRLYPTPAPVVVPPAVAPPRASGPAERARMRREFGVDPDTVVILQVARMEPWKGQQVLIEALHGLPGRWECWFVGSAQRPAEQRHELGLKRRARLTDLGQRVRFFGTRSDARALMTAADLYVHPTIEPESFGIVFVEALYAGLPVVASALGGALEIVTPDTGALVTPGDISELRDVLERLVGDAALRARLGAAGPARARAVAHPDQAVARLLTGLRPVLH